MAGGLDEAAGVGRTRGGSVRNAKMLRNVLIIATTSGLPLFSKEFLNAVAQPRLIGSLLTAMMEWAVRTTGMPVTYIELSNVAVTIVKDETAGICCALFHDRSDGPSFGKLVASQILYAFLEEYSGEVMGLGPNLKDFHGFHAKVEPDDGAGRSGAAQRAPPNL